MLVNDLEPAARALAPFIDAARAEAERARADHVMVAGSGPTVVGFFAGADGPERARRAAAGLAGRSPAAGAREPGGVAWPPGPPLAPGCEAGRAPGTRAPP